MKKYQFALLFWFFLIIATIVIFRSLTKPAVAPALAAKHMAVEQARLDLQLQHLARNDAALFYGSLAFAGMLSLSVVIVAVGIHRERVKKASVHIYEIGQSKVVIHERDLSVAWQIVTGLTNAEELKAINGGLDKALQLYSVMADVQSRQIQALFGKRGLPPALPPVETAALPAASPSESASPVPTFQHLLAAGRIAAGQPLIIGFRENGVPRTGSWQDLFSNATGGQSGSGKTNTLRSLIGQSLLQGVHFWVIDFHYPHADSLLFTLGGVRELAQVRYAHNHTEFTAILNEVNLTIDRRLAGQEPSTPIRVLCIDEVLRVVKNCAYAEDIIERIGTEGRKAQVYGIFSAQSWKADRVDSTARDNLTSIFAHYMKPNQAKPLLQDGEEVKHLKRLRPGQMMFYPVAGDSERLTVPFCTSADMATIANLVNNAVNRHVVDQGVDPVVDQVSQPTGLVKEADGDLVDQVKKALPNEGDFTALVKLIGCDKAYISRILNRKQPMSEHIRQQFLAWLHHSAAPKMP